MLRMEGDKLLHDTMKQLVTLSSGSIVIVIALLKAFPHWRVFVGIAFASFLTCIVAGLWVMRNLSLKMGLAYEEQVNKYQNTESWVYRIAAGGFLLAIGALIVFVILNLRVNGAIFDSLELP